MIKAIIFDCFGVLTTDHWKEFTYTLPVDIVGAARDLNHAYDRGEISASSFVEQVAEVTGHQEQEVAALISNESTKNHKLLAYIGQLKKAYKIGLLSNIGSSWITDEFLSVQEQELFDDMTLSYKVGVTKPDPRIYTAALDSLGVEPQSSVLVDDSESNCRGAEAVGLQAILYKDFESMKAELQKILKQK